MDKFKAKDKKVGTILIICLFVYCVVVGAYFMYLRSQSSDDNYTYIILNGENFYTYQDGTITDIPSLDTDFSNSSFYVYSDYQYSGEYTLSNLAVSYQNLRFSGTGNSYYTPDSPYIAITTDITYIDYRKEELDSDDTQEFESLMYSKNIFDTDDLASSYKINYDFDSDGDKEKIVCISNFDYITKRDNMFSIIYIVDDGEIQILEEYYYTTDNYLEFTKCNFSYLLKLDDDTYTFIISSSDDDVTVDNFYIKNGDKYEKI